MPVPNAKVPLPAPVIVSVTTTTISDNESATLDIAATSSVTEADGSRLVSLNAQSAAEVFEDYAEKTSQQAGDSHGHRKMHQRI